MDLNKLLEIAKNDEEFKKELADCLAKVESDRNLRLFEAKVFEGSVLREIAKSIFSANIFRRLASDSVRLVDDELSFRLRANSGDLHFRYNLKDYSLLDFTIIDPMALAIDKNEAKRRKQICDEARKRMSSFNTAKNEIICHTVIRKMQKNLEDGSATLSKDELEDMQDRLDMLKIHINDIPNVSVSDVESECHTAIDGINAIQDILERF